MKVITDCTGIKQDAIKGVFMGKFNPAPIEMTLNKGISLKTPLNEDDFHEVISKRLGRLHLLNEEKYDFSSSIQKGYYYKNGLWHLTAIVGIVSQNGNIVTAKASSVPVFKKSSDKKTEDRSRNFSDILSEDFPKWNKEKDSVYGLLTNGDDEKMWLQQPLRHCLYQSLISI